MTPKSGLSPRLLESATEQWGIDVNSAAPSTMDISAVSRISTADDSMCSVDSADDGALAFLLNESGSNGSTASPTKIDFGVVAGVTSTDDSPVRRVALSVRSTSQANVPTPRRRGSDAGKENSRVGSRRLSRSPNLKKAATRNRVAERQRQRSISGTRSRSVRGWDSLKPLKNRTNAGRAPIIEADEFEALPHRLMAGDFVRKVAKLNRHAQARVVSQMHWEV